MKIIFKILLAIMAIFAIANIANGQTSTSIRTFRNESTGITTRTVLTSQSGNPKVLESIESGISTRIIDITDTKIDLIKMTEEDGKSTNYWRTRLYGKDKISGKGIWVTAFSDRNPIINAKEPFILGQGWNSISFDEDPLDPNKPSILAGQE